MTADGQPRSAGDFLPLHPLEFRILLTLLDGASFGTRIVEAIEEAEGGGRKLYPANLYRRIRDLMSDGLVEDAPSPAGADPRRSYVRLTSMGRAVAKAEARRLSELVADARRHRLLTEG
ncbi:MAG: helix-turn-helix transcriptional regulator [Gemmatimonadota bacterium]|nr:helix-turn-helix transcriptional regulator [Gemmatimonadota bacterium]